MLCMNQGTEVEETLPPAFNGKQRDILVFLRGQKILNFDNQKQIPTVTQVSLVQQQLGG